MLDRRCSSAFWNEPRHAIANHARVVRFASVQVLLWKVNQVDHCGTLLERFALARSGPHWEVIIIIIINDLAISWSARVAKS